MSFTICILVYLQYAIAVREAQGNEDNWTEVPGGEVSHRKIIFLFLAQMHMQDRLSTLSVCVLGIPQK